MAGNSYVKGDSSVIFKIREINIKHIIELNFKK